jgi:hypothetical protein
MKSVSPRRRFREQDAIVANSKAKIHHQQKKHADGSRQMAVIAA